MPTRRMVLRVVVVVVAMEGIQGGLMGWGLGRCFIGLSRLFSSFHLILHVTHRFSHSCCNNSAADFRYAGSMTSMHFRKSMKAGISAAGISSGLRKGISVPFISLSGLVGFRYGIRRRFPGQISNYMEIGSVR